MSLTSSSIRKFAISVDPDEVVDFVQSIAFFEEAFSALGFEKIGTYKFRYKDEESTLTATLESGPDGYEVWMTVQAPNEHEYRIVEMAEALDGYIIGFSGTNRHTRHTTTSW